MRTLYILTGPAGVGKSTISSCVAKKLKKSVLIEGDDVYNTVISSYVSPWKEGNHLDFFWENIYAFIENAIKFDYDIVFNYIISKTDLEKIAAKFKNKVIIKFVCLLVSAKTLLKRDKKRDVSCRMGDRCLVLLNDFLNEKFDEGNILYTDDFTVRQTYNIVLNSEKYII